MALDRINAQASGILRALCEAPHASATTAAAATNATTARAHGPHRARAETIQGPARDILLREGQVTFDLARQLSLDSLLSASERSAHPFTSTFDLDAVGTLETAGRLSAAQRTFLYGLDTVQASLTFLRRKLAGSNGKVDGKLKAKLTQARATLSELVYQQRAAHDTLTSACVHAKLSPAERSAIFHDRAVAQLMEATAGVAEHRHDAIAIQLVKAAREALPEPNFA